MPFFNIGHSKGEKGGGGGGMEGHNLSSVL